MSDASRSTSASSRTSLWRGAGLAILALAVGLLATTQVTITGGLYGAYLLSRPTGRPFEIKDDLRLGDGPRLLVGFGFGRLRDRLRGGGSLPRVELEWDAVEGGGVVRNYFRDGTELQTVFGRYVDEDGMTPRGLFLGGAIADVAASTEQNESGMAFRDAEGWHHVWCTANEGVAGVGERGVTLPGAWSYLGSRVLVEASDRIVLQSEHEVKLRDDTLHVERHAYFTAGRPFVRLGINLANIGARPMTVSYAYGDEPWVGRFGSAEGNLGWTEAGILTVVSAIDTRRNGWAGIIDTKSGFANFLSWAESPPPDFAFVGNHAGTPGLEELYKPLDSNEIFIGLEWRDRVIEPGETLGIRLTVGLGLFHPDGRPTLPPEAVRSR